MEPLIILSLAIIAAVVIVITPVLTVTVPVLVIMAGRYMAVQQDAEAKSYREEMRHQRKLLELQLGAGDDGPAQDGPDFMGIINGLVPGLLAPRQPPAAPAASDTKPPTGEVV